MLLMSDAVVGLERTFYMVMETAGMVEVCAVVYEPSIPCPISFPFNVLLSSIDDTARTYTPTTTSKMIHAKGSIL